MYKWFIYIIFRSLKRFKFFDSQINDFVLLSYLLPIYMKKYLFNFQNKYNMNIKKIFTILLKFFIIYYLSLNKFKIYKFEWAEYLCVSLESSCPFPGCFFWACLAVSGCPNTSPSWELLITRPWGPRVRHRSFRRHHGLITSIITTCGTWQVGPVDKSVSKSRPRAMGHVTSWTKLKCRRCWKLTETMHTYKTHSTAGSLGLDLGQKAAVCIGQSSNPRTMIILTSSVVRLQPPNLICKVILSK